MAWFRPIKVVRWNEFPGFRMSSVVSGGYVMKREMPEACLESCPRVLAVRGIFLSEIYRLTSLLLIQLVREL